MTLFDSLDLRGNSHVNTTLTTTSSTPAGESVLEQIQDTVVVTIDGPAASGKSSVSRELARRFGWVWVSTGAFYRGVAWAAHHSGVNLDDEEAVAAFALSTAWRVRLDLDQTRFELHGEDSTDEIMKEAVGLLASKISSYPKVRQALLDAQRRCALGVKGLIAEGRDCGSVVFPQAVVKIFLTARAEARAARRATEEGRDPGDVVEQQKRRDQQDASRKAAPMVQPEGSLAIDTSGLTLNEVVDQIEMLILSKISYS